MVKRVFSGAIWVAVLSLLVAALPGPVTAQALPDVSIYTDYPTVIVQAGKSVKFPVRFVSNGTVDREFDITISGPEDWKPQLKDRSFLVRRVYLAGGKTQVVDFQVEPPANAAPGDHYFTIRAVATNGTGQVDLNLVVGVGDVTAAGLRLTTQYPVLRGGADKPFEFKIDLNNQADEDRDFTLAARAPDGWEVTLQPAYEKRQISGIRLKANETKGIDVQVTPPRAARAGEFPVVVAASAGAEQASVELKVEITGQYKVNIGTQSGVLNAQATAGEESRTTLNVTNSGSADLTNVTFSAQKPDGWEVWFQPESLDRVPTGQSRDVVMAMKPSGRAIPGDYMVRVTASNPQVSEQAGIRTTVGSSTAWGLVGLGIIALSIGGLYGVFRRFSRR
jgi:uncharacterized repeat protein (TIGR01451 family)